MLETKKLIAPGLNDLENVPFSAVITISWNISEKHVGGVFKIGCLGALAGQF
jgi:hypothetical protein